MKLDFAIVGLGAAGSFAAKELAELGFTVGAFEKETGVHAKGAYAGESRLFRTAYHEGSEYVDALLYSREQWRRADLVSGTGLFCRTGVLSVGPEDAPQMSGVLESLREYGLPHTMFRGQEISRWLPQLKDTSEDIAVLDELGGVIRSERAVQVLQAAAVRAGAMVFEQSAVLDVEDLGSYARVVTAEQEFEAAQVIVTAGVWTSEIVPRLRDLLEIRPIPLFWYLTDPAHDFRPSTFPGFIRDKGDSHVYGFPSLDGATVKMGSHLGVEGLQSPAGLPATVPDELLSENASIVHSLIAGLSERAIRSSLHMDVYTPDKRPVIDRVSERVVVATGFSGHGFKLSPAWGALAADLALGREPRFSRQGYRLDRLAAVPVAAASN